MTLVSRRNSSLTPITKIPSDGIAKGAETALSITAGHLHISRSGKAMNSAHVGDRVFLRMANGQVVTAHTEEAPE